MDVLTAIKGRRSIRRYSSKQIEKDKLDKILEAGRLSPSARNTQSWKFIVVTDEKTRLRLAKAAGGQDFISQAPVTIVACGTNPEHVMRCGQYAYTIDVSIAMAYMILEAYELGLGTCWLGHFDENQVKEILNIPDGVRVVAMTPLGYPAESPPQRPRKDIKEIVCFEKYK